jgi:hypothetical protein
VKTVARVVALFLFALLSSLLMASQAQAAVSCHKINAKATGQDDFHGTTVANLTGGGLLNGTVVEHYSIIPPGPVFHFDSIQTFTTKHGTLAVHIPGTFDISTGHFEGAGPVIGATGKLAGATGMIALSNGVEDLTTGKYTEDISGEICVDLAP